MPSPSVSDGDDPYAPRSTAEYYYSDSASSSGSSTPSSSTSSRSSASSAPPREAPRHSQSQAHNGDNAQRSQSPSLEANEEPLFGGDGGPPGTEERAESAMDPSNTDEEEERDSFYAILNVQKDASEEEIRDAYRSLAVLLHPDKHTSPALKASAENRFRAIQKAYEVLSDTEKRSIYDHFGAQGLTQSWSLVQRSTGGGPRTAAEMREEWERMARKKKADEVENLIRSKGEFTANVDASSLFCSADRVPRSKQVMQQLGRELAMREREIDATLGEGKEVEITMPPVAFGERWNRVGVTSLMGKHGWETPITNYTRLQFNGQMVSRNGMGGGNLLGTVRTQWSHKFGTETTMTLMRPRVATFKASYQVNQFSFLTFVASSTTLAVPPQLSLSYAQQLSQKSLITGFTSVKTGAYTLGPWGADSAAKMRQEPPSIAVGVTSQSGNGKGWTCQTSLGLENQVISVDYAFRPAFLGSPKMTVGMNLGTRSGLSAFHQTERKVTDNVKIGFGVNFGLPLGGVSFRLRFDRLGQKVNVPIQVSPEYRADLVAAFTVVPLASMLAVEHLYMKPMKRKKISSKLANLRKSNSGLILERKLAALEARSVLREAARKKADLERRRDGLVILEAYYGKRETWPAMGGEASPEELFDRAWGQAASPHLSSSEHTATDAATAAAAETTTAATEGQEDEQMWWDVRVAVMILVNKGQLIIPGGRHKSKILGFFDPCMGERKHLVIRYLFRNRLHEAIVDDVTQLAAPLRSHQL